MHHDQEHDTVTRTITPYPAEHTAPDLCWLCGTDAGRQHSDPYFRPRWLCPPCWKRQPVARTEELRAVEALTAVLDLPPDRRTSAGWMWLHEAAARHGVAAWDDHCRTAPGVWAPAPTGPFGWIPTEIRERAAADLDRAAVEHARNAVPPEQRKQTGA